MVACSTEAMVELLIDRLAALGQMPSPLLDEEMIGTSHLYVFAISCLRLVRRY